MVIAIMICIVKCYMVLNLPTIFKNHEAVSEPRKLQSGLPLVLSSALQQVQASVPSSTGGLNRPQNHQGVGANGPCSESSTLQPLLFTEISHRGPQIEL